MPSDGGRRSSWMQRNYFNFIALNFNAMRCSFFGRRTRRVFKLATASSLQSREQIQNCTVPAVWRYLERFRLDCKHKNRQKTFTTVYSRISASWKCVPESSIFELNENEFLYWIISQASFVNFSDSFHLNAYHEASTASCSQRFRHLFMFQEQHGGATNGSQRQLSLDTFLPSKSQQPPNVMESARTNAGTFSSLSLRHWNQ